MGPTIECQPHLISFLLFELLLHCLSLQNLRERGGAEWPCLMVNVEGWIDRLVKPFVSFLQLLVI